MKLISYNLEYAKAATPADIAAYLKPHSPDLVCFCEVPNGEWTSLVGKEMGMDYFYVGEIASANHDHEYPDKTGNFYGKFKSILSKTPLTNMHEKALTGIGWTPVSVVFAQTIIDGKSLLIGSLHIPSGINDPKNNCAANLATLMESYTDSRIIISGDYNDLVNSAPLQALYDKGFKNSWLTTNYNLENRKTCNAKSEKDYGVIDHSLYRGALNVLTTDILISEYPLSDHCAISCTFSL